MIMIAGGAANRVDSARSDIMTATSLVKYAGALVALAICSACGDYSAGAPSTATLDYQYIGRTLSVHGRLVTAERPPSALGRYASFLPDLHAKSENFEYIANFYGTSIFDWPKSDQQIGEISNVGGQECANVLYGYGTTFWIVAGEDQITEYKVVKKLIKTLSVSAGLPSSCAMDTSGDLAVGILYSSTGSAGDIVIFKNASGSGTVYKTPLDLEYFDGYDKQGNLFADGFNGDRSSMPTLVELRRGSSKFRTITTSNTLDYPGSVQWDGKYLTVSDQQVDAIYRYTVSGTKATLKNTVQLTGAGDCAQTWIVKGLVYCADAGTNGAEVFKYPAGGSPIATLKGNFDSPLGVVAAKK